MKKRASGWGNTNKHNLEHDLPNTHTHTRAHLCTHARNQEKSVGWSRSWLRSLLFWLTDFLFQAAMTPITTTQLHLKWTGTYNHEQSHTHTLSFIFYLATEITCEMFHNFFLNSHNYTQISFHMNTQSFGMRTRSLMPYLNQMSRNLWTLIVTLCTFQKQLCLWKTQVCIHNGDIRNLNSELEIFWTNKWNRQLDLFFFLFDLWPCWWRVRLSVVETHQVYILKRCQGPLIIVPVSSPWSQLALAHSSSFHHKIHSAIFVTGEATHEPEKKMLVQEIRLKSSPVSSPSIISVMKLKDAYCNRYTLNVLLRIFC